MRERKVRARDVERPQSKYRGKRRCLLSSLVYLAQAPVGCPFPWGSERLRGHQGLLLHDRAQDERGIRGPVSRQHGVHINLQETPTSL